MAAPRILRLAPEYGCWPTWDDETGDTLDPTGLPIPAGLVERILRWDESFQATLDDDYPPHGRFPDVAAEAAWRAEGNALFAALSNLLGADCVRRRAPL